MSTDFSGEVNNRLYLIFTYRPLYSTRTAEKKDDREQQSESNNQETTGIPIEVCRCLSSEANFSGRSRGHPSLEIGRSQSLVATTVTVVFPTANYVSGPTRLSGVATEIFDR